MSISDSKNQVAYAALAPIYDRVMHHVRYDEWAGLIRRVIENFSGAGSPSVLEIGGGTGVLGQKLREQGIRYFGSDRSPQMCRVARQRKLPFIAADGRRLPVHTGFGLIVFLYDGINYLRNLEDYDRLYGEVHRCLDPKGLFLFDITTPANSLKHFEDYFDCEDFSDSYYVRHSYYNSATHVQYNDFTIFRRCPGRESLYERFEEHHAQSVFTAATIEDHLPRELFDVVGVWDGFTFRRYSRESERVHFLLRKRDTG